MDYAFKDIQIGTYYEAAQNSYKYYRVLNKVTGGNGFFSEEVWWSGWDSSIREWSTPIASYGNDPDDLFASGFTEISWLDLPNDVPICSHDLAVIVETPKTQKMVWRDCGKTRCLMTVEEVLPGDEVYKYA